jgi:hypothetical protein
MKRTFLVETVKYLSLLAMLALGVVTLTGTGTGSGQLDDPSHPCPACFPE